MNDRVTPWPKQGRPVALPVPIRRPCDYGLQLAVTSLEVQLGSIEAYNRLVASAQQLKARIDAGAAQAQNPLFAVSLDGSGRVKGGG